MTAIVMTKGRKSTLMGDDPSFDAFLAYLHDDNATGKAGVTALPITTRQYYYDHQSERLPSLHNSTVKTKNQSVHRVSLHPTPPHMLSSSTANGKSNIDRPSIINRRQSSTRSSNGEKTTIAHNNNTTNTTTTTTTPIDAIGARGLQKRGGTTNNNPTIHNNNKRSGGGSSPRRYYFTAPVIIELDNKYKYHHNILQGLQHGGGGINNKTKGVKNKKGGGMLRRFDRMFHPPAVTSTAKILDNFNINIKDDEEILSIGISSITSNGSKRSIHSTLLDPFFAKTPIVKRNNMEACNPRERMPSSSFHQHCSTNDEYSLQYSLLLPLEDTSELVVDEVAAECNIRESTTKDDYDIRDDLVELFLRGGKEKVDSQLHNSFDDTIVIRGGGGERTRFDEEKDRRRRKPKRTDGREHQLIFI